MDIMTASRRGGLDLGEVFQHPFGLVVKLVHVGGRGVGLGGQRLQVMQQAGKQLEGRRWGAAVPTE